MFKKLSFQCKIAFLFQGQDRFGAIESQFQELRAWLTAKIGWFDQLHLSQGQAPMDYEEYMKFKADTAAKRQIYQRLRQLQETTKNIGIAPEAWKEVDTNWQKVEAQVGQPLFSQYLFSIFRNKLYYILLVKRLLSLSFSFPRHFSLPWFRSVSLHHFILHLASALAVVIGHCSTGRIWPDW